MLQQAALQQTGKASFIDGLSYDSKTGTSVTEQEKAYLYQNALDYAKANNLQLGEALTQTQINALDKPMLWYVEQTVPDPSCTAVGHVTCPTITALMPQVYLPSDTSAMSAGGNIQGNNVTLNFNQDGNGSILNTGGITASDTLTVNTNTLTNQANQVDIGQIWSKVKGGYVDETGTTVQPGGFMSAANMDMNVQTLNQIGGALQKLDTDGTIDQAGTQIILGQIQQQLGSAFSQVAVSDNLHTQFVQEGGLGAFGQVLSIAIEIVASFYLGPLAGALGSVNWGSVGKAVAVAELTAGIDAGLGLNGASGFSDIGNGAVYANSSITLADVGQTAMNVAERSLVSAGVSTAIYGGSFGQALKHNLVSNVAAVGANFIGDEFNQSSGLFSNTSPLYYAAHAALGCASSAALGTGCAGGAIGGATSAIVSPFLVDQAGAAANLTNDQRALIVGASTLLGGLTAGLVGQNAQGGATAAANEALNNSTGDHRTEEEKAQDAIKAQQQKEAATMGQGRTVKTENGETYVTGSSAIGGLGGNTKSTDGPMSTWDTSNTTGKYLNVDTDLTPQQFQANLMSNGYSVTSQGTNKNGPFTVLNNGSSTYTIYTRSSTGGAGVQYFGPGGTSGKFSLKGR